MPRPDRRDILALLAACGIGTLGAAALAPHPSRAAPPRLAQLVVHGMPSTPSIVIERLIEAGALAPFTDRPQLRIWRNADQMRTGVVSGDMQVFGTPTYTCANLLNRGVPVRQVNVLTWGLLYLLSRDPAIERIEDIAGQAVLVAYRHDAPDLIFRLVLRRLGLDPERDVRLQYVGSPSEAAQLLLAGRAALAVLAEPAATAAEVRAVQAGVSLRRTVDLTEVYGRLAGQPARIPQAGLAVREEFLQQHPDVVEAIHEGCVTAARWMLDHPDAAGRLGAPLLDLGPATIARSIPHFRLDVVSAADARGDLERYFSELIAMSPGIVGGRLPDDRFYWGRTG
ncbi:MAG: ABC transporter substrate-binding protein [Rhodovulum sp.]|nr:ABC transporter substrate-binding protein [Rhodovulum sp.]